jgi:hypothetical protein
MAINIFYQYGLENKAQPAQWVGHPACRRETKPRMEEKYEPQVIERQWQARWQAENLFRATEDESRPKY